MPHFDTASVSTGVPVRDALLRRDDLLASCPHPQAFFVADTVRLQVQSEGIRQTP